MIKLTQAQARVSERVRERLELKSDKRSSTTRATPHTEARHDLLGQ